MERQRDFFGSVEEPIEDFKAAQLREAVSQYVDLEKLRNPKLDVKDAFRFDYDNLPHEIQALSEMLEVLLSPSTREQIKVPADLARYYQVKIGYKPQEQFWVISLNTKNRVLGHTMVYQGTIDTSMVRIVEVFEPARVLKAAQIAIIHNHPSGLADPSEEDKMVTREIIRAGKLFGCDLIDSLVVGEGSYTSLKESCYHLWK